MPEIKLITETGRKYCRFPEPGFMLFLIMNDFTSWDFYCLNYVLSNQEFRKNLNYLSSIEKNLNLKNKKNIFISELENGAFGYLRERHYKFSLEKKTLSVFLTDVNRNNYLYSFLPYKILVANKTFKIKNNIIFDFNFHQMIILSKIELLWNLPKFIRKILNINFKTTSFSLDYDYLDKINENFLKFTKEYEEKIELSKLFYEINIM